MLKKYFFLGIFLKNGDGVEIRFASADFANSKIIKTSGFSIMSATEDAQKATFTANFKVKLINLLPTPESGTEWSN